jgi:hypothetical protein
VYLHLNTTIHIHKKNERYRRDDGQYDSVTGTDTLESDHMINIAENPHVNGTTVPPYLTVHMIWNSPFPKENDSKI